MTFISRHLAFFGVVLTRPGFTCRRSAGGRAVEEWSRVWAWETEGGARGAVTKEKQPKQNTRRALPARRHCNPVRSWQDL